MTLAYFHQYNADIPDYRITLFGHAAGTRSARQLLRLPRRLHAHANRCRNVQGRARLLGCRHHPESGPLCPLFTRFSLHRAVNRRLGSRDHAAHGSRRQPQRQYGPKRRFDAVGPAYAWTVRWVDWRASTILRSSVSRAATKGPRRNSTTAAVSPRPPLLNPDENLYFTAANTYPRYKTHLTADSVAPFAIDTVKSWANTGKPPSVSDTIISPSTTTTPIIRRSSPGVIVKTRPY